MRNQINRKTIATLLSISETYLSRITRESRCNMPKPSGVKGIGGAVMYFEDEIQPWIATHRAQIISSKLDKEIKAGNSVTIITNHSITPSSFISGRFDGKTTQNKHRLKRLASSVTKPVTTKVITPYNNYGEYHERLL